MNAQASNSAETTTDWARERTRLAKERTFAASIRTALSLIGFGIAVAKLLPDLNPPWVAQIVGLLLIVGGGISLYMGWRITHDIVLKLRQEGVAEPHWFNTGSMLLLLIAAVAALLFVGLG